MDQYRPEAFGEMMADVYDEWYGTRIADESTKQAVEVLADLAAGGTVLELAIGTGRVALPLAERGLSVSGIEASEKMIAKLRDKPGGTAIPVTLGDFADVAVEGSFDLIYLVFNTLFNLTSQDDQVRCFQNVAGRLSERGVFVIEAFVPDIAELNRQATRTVHVTNDSATLEAAVHDPVSQVVRYQYIVLTNDGAKLYPVPQRYAWPSELDLMARLAGLERRERWSGWDRLPFNEASANHITIYYK